jgi:queuosine precursor transporter
VVDWGVFAKSSGTWMQRSTKSNVAGAAVDSVIFPTLSFGVLMPHIVAMQFVAKVAGGAVWGYLISKKVAA